VSFADELTTLLPADLPNREDAIERTARHLDAIVEANSQFNLTRITDPRSAAIKHVLDSVMPWRLFESAEQVVDAGTGAGFPGIPLALVLPGVRFTLAESIGKKARFVQAVARDLKLTNVEVVAVRAEELLRSTRAEIVTARAVAPIGRAAGLFFEGLKHDARVLLYKGPDANAEIIAAQTELKKWRLVARIIEAYELPDGAGSRTIVELRRSKRI
jgi:16S rRNA (guanine527-N7)-methyltransferase